jgi:hypothetical protein
MAKQDINIGAAPGDGTGDVVREAFRKSKENFDELYNRSVGDMNKSVYDSDDDGSVNSADKIKGIDAAANETFYGKDNAGNIGFHTVESGTYAPPAPYATKAALLADQVNQIEHEEYTVEDASDWTGITSGWATFQKKAASTASESDYILREYEDSGKVKDIQDSSGESVVDEFGIARFQAVGDPSKSNEVDVFVIYGQSNAAGGTLITSGDPVQVPTDYGYKWDYANNNGGGIQQLSDPTRKDGQQKISAWPAFGLQWGRLTGRPAVIVNMAEGGRTVLELSPGQVNGYFDDMIQATNDTISALTTAGKTINSLQMYWCQGENDIADTSLTDYITRLDDIWSNFDTNFTSYTPKFYLSKIWGAVNNTDPEYWKKAEALGFEQVNATKTRDRWSCVFDKAPLFNRANGLISPDDYVHYSQKGYNWMGKESAVNIYEQERYTHIKNEHLERNLSVSLTTTEDNLPALFYLAQQSLGSPLGKIDNDRITLWDGDITHKDTGSDKYFSTLKYFPFDPNDGNLLTTPATLQMVVTPLILVQLGRLDIQA